MEEAYRADAADVGARRLVGVGIHLAVVSAHDGLDTPGRCRSACWRCSGSGAVTRGRVAYLFRLPNAVDPSCSVSSGSLRRETPRQVVVHATCNNIKCSTN
jgi:hypothetical protein